MGKCFALTVRARAERGMMVCMAGMSAGVARRREVMGREKEGKREGEKEADVGAKHLP